VEKERKKRYAEIEYVKKEVWRHVRMLLEVLIIYALWRERYAGRENVRTLKERASALV
jgi:hypothetical protein